MSKKSKKSVTVQPHIAKMDFAIHNLVNNIKGSMFIFARSIFQNSITKVAVVLANNEALIDTLQTYIFIRKDKSSGLRRNRKFKQIIKLLKDQLPAAEFGTPIPDHFCESKIITCENLRQSHTNITVKLDILRALVEDESTSNVCPDSIISLGPGKNLDTQTLNEICIMLKCSMKMSLISITDLEGMKTRCDLLDSQFKISQINIGEPETEDPEELKTLGITMLTGIDNLLSMIQESKDDVNSLAYKLVNAPTWAATPQPSTSSAGAGSMDTEGPCKPAPSAAKQKRFSSK